MSAEPRGPRPSSGIPTLPSSGATSVFDVEPPVEPQLPSAGVAAPAPPVRRSGQVIVDGGAAAAKVAKRARRRRRRHDKVLGRAAIVVLLGGVAAAGYAGYESFRSEQDDEQFTVDPETGNSVLIDAVDDARDVVGDTDDTAAPETVAPQRLAQPLEVASILPPDVDLIGRSLDPVAGFTRYLIDADLAINAQRQGAGDWLASLRALPQSTSVGDASLVPALASGQLLIAYRAADGVHVDRLVVAGPDYDIVIDAVAG